MQVQTTEKEIKTVTKTITIELTELQAVELMALLGQCRSKQNFSLFKKLWDAGLNRNQKYYSYVKNFEDFVHCPTLTNI